jgi:hypothetical protein
MAKGYVRSVARVTAGLALIVANALGAALAGEIPATGPLEIPVKILNAEGRA